MDINLDRLWHDIKIEQIVCGVKVVFTCYLPKIAIDLILAPSPQLVNLWNTKENDLNQNNSGFSLAL